MQVGFLGYDRTQTCLIDFLESEGCEIRHTTEPVTREWAERELIISFGYRHILRPEFLRLCHRPPINLHISFLPYNRGAHPVFWAFHDKTKIGVTVHEIDEGLDTGPILFRKEVLYLSPRMTFAFVHNCLLREVERLFMGGWIDLKTGNELRHFPQNPGSIHRSRDLPEWSGGWDARIGDALQQIGPCVADHIVEQDEHRPDT